MCKVYDHYDTSTTIRFTISGYCVPKQRPRFDVWTGKVFTPMETQEYEQHVADCYHAQHGDTMLIGPIIVKIKIYEEYGVIDEFKLSLRQSGYCHPQSPGDLDNKIKSILDGLVKANAIPDDRFVFKIEAERLYAEKPYVEVELSNVDVVYWMITNNYDYVNETGAQI